MWPRRNTIDEPKFKAVRGQSANNYKTLNHFSNRISNSFKLADP